VGGVKEGDRRVRGRMGRREAKRWGRGLSSPAGKLLRRKFGPRRKGGSKDQTTRPSLDNNRKYML